MHPTNTIGYLLQHVASLLSKQSEQVLQEQLGIGISQFKILRTLQAEPHTPQREIAFNLGQTEASISRQVKLMTQDGLLHITRSPKDHREHLTVPTKKGERLTAAAMTVLERYFSPCFSALSDKQQAQLASTLDTLHATVCSRPHPNPAQQILEL